MAAARCSAGGSASRSCDARSRLGRLSARPGAKPASSSCPSTRPASPPRDGSRHRRRRARWHPCARRAVFDRGAQGVTEDYPFQPIPEKDFYARSKRAAEQLIHADAAHGELSVVSIRPNVIYGERDLLFTRRLIGNLKRGFLPQVGPGTNHLSCVYAGNVASAILAALDAPARPGFRAYNVTRDASPLLTQREFFAAFAEALGRRPFRVR